MLKNSPGDHEQKCISGTKKEIDLIEWIRSIDNLGRAIRNVHDFAVHFSSIEIEGKLKSDLYFTAQTANFINEIEINTKMD